MAESKRPNYRTKGAVLIMVLTIMFVLIIMLIATLSVVANAKKRTYTSFEETQANLTARSAVEFFVKDLSNNNAKNVTGSVDPYYTTSTEMTYARQIEMDIRTLTALDTDKSVSGTGATEDWYNDWLDDPSTATIPAGCDPTNFSYDDNDPDALFQQYDSTTGTVPAQMTVGGTAITYNNGSAKAGKSPMLKYEVTLPKAEDHTSTKKYGKFADQKVLVTVEVLERYFNKAPDPTSTTMDPKPDSAKFGDRTKDYVKLRVTATAVFNDYESTTVIIVEPTDPPVVTNNDFTKGVVATGSASATPKIYALGGMASNSDYVVTDNKIFDSLYVNGDIHFVNSGTLSLGDDCYIASTKNINFWSSQNITTETDKSFIYAGGTFNLYSGAIIGSSTKRLNVICNGGYLDQGTINGDVYCDGDLYINGAKIDGNVYCNGTIYFTEDKFLKASDKTDNTTWYFQYGGQGILGNFIANSVKFYSETAAAYYQAPVWPATVGTPHYPVKTEGTVFGSPAKLNNLTTPHYVKIGDNTSLAPICSLKLKYITSPALLSMTGSAVGTTTDYRTDGDTNRIVNSVSSGNIAKTITYKLPASITETDYSRSYEIPSIEFEYPVYLSVKDYTSSGSDQTGFEFKGYVSALAKYNADTSQSKTDLTLTGNADVDNSNKIIKTSGILPKGDYNGYKIQSGITLQLEAGDYKGNMVTTDDASKTIFLIPDSTAVNFQAKILSAELYKVLTDPAHKDLTVYSGKQADVTKLCGSPNIYMYAGTGATVTIHEPDSTYIPLINAYIYAPNANLNVTTKGSLIHMNYNGKDDGLNTHGCFAVGAMVFGNVNSTEEGAVVFIKGGTSSTPHTPGHSFIPWGVNHYTNDKEYGNT